MSTVIKAGQTGPILGHLSTVDLVDHLAEAEAVLQKAQRNASGTLSRARTDAEQLRERAKQQGYAEGYELGLSEGRKNGSQAAHNEAMECFRQEHNHIVQVMKQAVTEIDAVKEDITIAARKDVLDLALLVARKLTFAVGERRPEAVLENVSRALRIVGTKTNLAIRVHPQDVASIERFAESTLAHLRAADAVTIVADESMAPGGCKVENERIEVDATLETQVAEIITLLLGERRDDQ